MKTQKSDFDVRVAILAALLQRKMYEQNLSVLEVCKKISAHPGQYEEIILNHIRFEDIPKPIIRSIAEMYSIAAVSLMVKTRYLNVDDFTVTGVKEYDEIQDSLDLCLTAVEEWMTPLADEEKAA